MAATLSLLRFAPHPPPHHLTRSPLTINLTPSTNRTVRIRPRVPPISASYDVSYVDRAISTLSYVLPLLKSLPYGRVLQSRVPIVASLISPFLPVLSVYSRLPSPGLLGFLALYIFLARNRAMSRYVQFNAMQALVLDVILGLPVLVQGIVQRIVRNQSSRAAFRAMEYGYGAIFVFGLVTFVYSASCCLLGRTPYLPFVSSAADQQIP